MAVTVLNPAIHLVRETPAGRMFRSKLRDDNIVTFFHAETGQWILAYYLDRRRGIVDEIEDMGGAFEEVTPDFVHMILTNYGGVNLKRLKTHLISLNNNKIRAQNDGILADQERWDWMKKRIQDRAPIPYMYKTPMSGGAIGTPKMVG